MNLPLHLVWLRHDLRLHDNQALHAASMAARQDGGTVVALFIATAQTWRQHDMALIREDLLRRRVLAMQTELAALQIPLLATEGSDYASCQQILAQFLSFGLAAVYVQQEYELREQNRDKQVANFLQQNGVSWHSFERLCFMPPGTIRTQQGEIYKVFSPFKRNWLQRFAAQGVQCFAKPEPQPRPPVNLPQLPDMQAPQQLSAAWIVNEAEVLQKMRRFCQQQVNDYQRDRDYPALSGTSQLSAYLAIGILSVQQCVARLQLEAPELMWQEKTGAAVWLGELIWRDFYKHILWAFPHLIKHQAFQVDTDLIVWPNQIERFEAWCQGQTGYPIVDAAMRQLNTTGWMHNRLRMITASFLVKDLHIDWRWGERYFMTKLIDGDFAANNGGWQWAASTGTDAAPYFRIFNPVTQSEKFDPQGDFIKHFVPELASKQGKELHWPHKVVTPKGYVKPIVQHDEARKITLSLFQAIKGQTQE